MNNTPHTLPAPYFTPTHSISEDSQWATFNSVGAEVEIHLTTGLYAPPPAWRFSVYVIPGKGGRVALVEDTTYAEAVRIASTYVMESVLAEVS